MIIYLKKGEFMIYNLYLNKTATKFSVANFGYAANDLNIVFNWQTRLYIFNTIMYFKNCLLLYSASQNVLLYTLSFLNSQ